MIKIENFKYLDTESYDLVAFLQKSDSYFNPPLSERVALSEYAEKLKKEAVIHAAIEAGELIGLSAFYCNPNHYESAFLTFIVAFQPGRGIGDLLIRELITFCRAVKMKSIETQTWEGNEKSLSLFNRHGFKQIGVKNNRSNEVLSIILKYDFN